MPATISHDEVREQLRTLTFAHDHARTAMLGLLSFNLTADQTQALLRGLLATFITLRVALDAIAKQWEFPLDTAYADAVRLGEIQLDDYILDILEGDFELVEPLALTEAEIQKEIADDGEYT